MPPQGQQGVNTRNGPWEGTRETPSLYEHRKTHFLLFPEQMGQSGSAEWQL